MKLEFSESPRKYQSGSQIARVLTELWIAEKMYCPNCGNPSLKQFPPNLPVADFFCANCNDQYELKSQRKEFGKKLINGAYQTKLKRLESDSSPNLILMNYDAAATAVRNVCLIPRRFFVRSLVEKRKPLSITAKRAGWVGSNILINKIPESGRIHLIRDGVVSQKVSVLAQWQRTAFLDDKSQLAKGWLLEVMSCLDRLKEPDFTLDDVYRFEVHLSSIYPENKNVRPKIRQQLQVLRDNGYLEFLGSGHYRLVR